MVLELFAGRLLLANRLLGDGGVAPHPDHPPPRGLPSYPYRAPHGGAPALRHERGPWKTPGRRARQQCGHRDGSLRGEEERRKEGRRRRGDTLLGATESRGQALLGATARHRSRLPAPTATKPASRPPLMPLRPPLQPRSWEPRGRRRPTAGHRRDLRVDAGTYRRTPPVSHGKAPPPPPSARTPTRGRALRPPCARTLEPRPGGRPASWKQPLPVLEPGVVAFVWDEEIRMRGTMGFYRRSRACASPHQPSVLGVPHPAPGASPPHADDASSRHPMPGPRRPAPTRRRCRLPAPRARLPASRSQPPAPRPRTPTTQAPGALCPAPGVPPPHADDAGSRRSALGLLVVFSATGKHSSTSQAPDSDFININ
ncbi:uncharacterized protein [Miscanthus floridulus]|uniref:uncharacterized protein n=1 Tax=Miscanthus floridulus TaxID=154761 RepID=UPI00345A8FA6